MNIKEIRDKYPQYADLDDRSLALALHKKYYADMPVNEYLTKVGFEGRQAAAPRSTGSEIPKIKDNLLRMAFSAGQGLLTGGPVGLAASATNEGMRQLGAEHTKAAYNVGGAVTDVGARMGLSPEVSAGAGYAANVGTQAIPTIVGAVAGREVLKQPFQAAGRGLMRSALKPGAESVRTGDAGKAIQTMLDEGFNVTPGGVQKMRTLVNQLDDQVTAAIASSPATVNKGYALSALQKPLQKFKQQVNPGADLKAIQNAWDEFKHSVPNDIPVQLAQDLKRGTYRVLAGKYGEVGSASTEAQKGLARGLKEGIEAQVPQVAALNAREGRLLNALELADRRAAIAANRNPIGLGWITPDIPRTAGFLADRSQLLKSLAARGLYRIGPPVGTTTGGGLGGILGMESGQP